MCAIEAGKRGRAVALLERAERLGKKILISGGGRCNFTNIHCTPENFLSSNPHFAKSALSRYMPTDFIALVEKHKIPFHEKTLGQLFCDRSARDIMGMLEEECSAAGVKIFLNVKIHEISRPAEFSVRADRTEFQAPVLVVASGGLSIPKIGATSFGYDLARQFGMKVCEPRPGLVPLVFEAQDRSRYCDLAGVSAEVVATLGAEIPTSGNSGQKWGTRPGLSLRKGVPAAHWNGQYFREKMLITHRGMSGPAILQISSYWKTGMPIHIDLAPGAENVFGDPKKPRNVATLRADFRKILPQRLADRWLEFHAPSSYTNTGIKDFERQVHTWSIMPAGTEGYEKAEVTAGGVDTNELSAKTMEARNVPGLFFIGEVVDVTGQLGGFNFQWAWASGAAAGRAI